MCVLYARTTVRRRSEPLTAVDDDDKIVDIVAAAAAAAAPFDWTHRKLDSEPNTQQSLCSITIHTYKYIHTHTKAKHQPDQPAASPHIDRQRVQMELSFWCMACASATFCVVYAAARVRSVSVRWQHSKTIVRYTHTHTHTTRMQRARDETRETRMSCMERYNVACGTGFV